MALDQVPAVKAFWEAQASKHELPEDLITHRDRNQRLLEIEVLSKYLPDGQRMLDVGCGNGFSTALFAKCAAEIIGIDYSHAMIERAKLNFGALPNISFQVQDLLALKFDSSTFDVVISQRCLINLGTWDNQQKAISNIAKVLKPRGYFFLQEGTKQGRASLDETRERLGLNRMPTVAFNLDFDEETLWPYIRRYFDVVEVRRFGLYDLISRVVHPLMVSPSEPQYEAKINDVARRVAAEFRGMDELSREFSAVLRRRTSPSGNGRV